MTDQNIDQLLDRVMTQADPELKSELVSLESRVQDLQTENEQLRDEKEGLQTELEKTNRGTLQLASELEERYQQLFESAIEGIYTTTATLDEYVMANPAFADLLGYENGEKLCAAVDSIEEEVFVDPDAYATYSESLTSVGELKQFEYRIRTADGGIRWVSDSATALTDDEGTIEGYRGGIIDITAQKKREQSLVRQQQLNTVLLRVFRHNIRNEFTVIRGYTDMIVDQLDDDSVDVTAVTSAIDRVLALAEKSTELDAFLMEEVERKSFDLMTVIQQASTDIEGDHPEASIEVTGPDELPVSGYQNLKAAIRELIENACKHTEGTPTVTVSVEVNQGTIELEVSDNGPGLPEQEYRVLETGTEEPLVHGQGLGLWMVYWIITGHNGDIATTASDEGTTITITLPQSIMGMESNDTSEMVSRRQQSGDIFQRIFEETADTLVIIDDDGQTLRANESAANLIGLPKEEVLGRSFDEFTDDSFDFNTILQDDRGSGLQRETATLVRPDGSERITECSVTQDIVSGMHLIVCRDITERKEREQEVQRLKERLELAVEAGGVGFYDWNMTTDEVEFSDQFVQMLGYSKEEFGDGLDAWKKRCHPDDLERVEADLEAHINGETSRFNHEARVQTPDGDWKWVQGTGRIVDRDEDGNPLRALGIQLDISERKERELELSELSQQLQGILDTAPVAIFVKDTDGRYLQMNQKCRDNLGIGSDEDVVGLTDDDLFPEDIAAQYRADDERVFEENETIEIEEEVPTPDGTRIHLTRKTPISDEDGNTDGLCAIASDITDRKEREQELERAEMVFQTTQDALFLIDVVDDSGFRIRRVNEAYEDNTGLTSAELTGKTPREAVGDEVGSKIESRYHECVERREPIRYVEEVPIEGESRFWETKLSPLIEDGTVTQLVGATRDITERRERERELSKVNERYETLLAAAPDPVFVADGETDEIIEANDAAETLLGMPSDEIIDSHQSELHPSDQADLYRQLFEQHVQTGGTRRRLPDGSPIQIVTADGDRVPVEISVDTVSLPDGPVTYGIFRDISDRVERERELAEKTRQLKAIVQNTSEAIYIKDTERYYQFINESGAELFGHTPEEIIGKHDEDLFDSESAADIRADDKQVMESGEEMSKETVRFIDGEEHIFLDNKYPYRDEDGEIIGMIGISPDITERKQYVRGLERRNDRFDFASVVSHDLQNPLNVAQGQLDLAQEECESEHLDAIEYAHERMETLINDLLTLSRTGKTIDDPEAVTLEALSDECWQNVETKDSDIHITTDEVIQADRSRLKQLLENLFRNAVEHGGEDVTVSIGDLDSDHGFYVKDDGSGVPEGDRDQLFEPGYTTNQGTGLGLKIVKQIASAHGWEVTVSSGSEGGARFEFAGVECTDEPHSSTATADDTQDADAEESNE